MNKHSTIPSFTILDPLVDLKKFITHFIRISKDFLVGGSTNEARSSSIESSMISNLNTDRSSVIAILSCFDRLLFFIHDNEVDPIVTISRREINFAKKTLEWFFNHVYPVVSRFIHQWIDSDDSYLEELPFTIQNIHNKLISVQQNSINTSRLSYNELARSYNGVNDF